jgi:hypothetical protein
MWKALNLEDPDPYTQVPDVGRHDYRNVSPFRAPKILRDQQVIGRRDLVLLQKKPADGNLFPLTSVVKHHEQYF